MAHLPLLHPVTAGATLRYATHRLVHKALPLPISSSCDSAAFLRRATGPKTLRVSDESSLTPVDPVASVNQQYQKFPNWRDFRHRFAAQERFRMRLVRSYRPVGPRWTGGTSGPVKKIFHVQFALA